MHLFSAIVVTAFACAAAPGTVSAQNASHDRARAAMEAGQVRPLADILARVRGQVPGRLLDAELAQQGWDGRWQYDIRLLQANGQVLAVTVDAETGQILDVSGRNKR
jgi:uncharacterized membrane protein YkoI